MSGAVYPLHGAQLAAVEPRDTVWLSASAGTGKTQVLSARVLRLLLEPGVEPSQLLCLTFTKAGAAEMAVRVNAVLARWVRMEDGRLGRELGDLGAPVDPDTRERARTLFAKVLDCPGGGLRIDTIHAFAQWLLATFPEEAGLVPGMRAMEDRDRVLLARETFAALVAEAEAINDRTLLDPVEMLSTRLGPDGVMSWLLRCAEHRAAWFGAGGWSGPLRPRVFALLGLDEDTTSETIADGCTDARFAIEALEACADAGRSWGTKTGLAIAGAVGTWRGLDKTDRLEGLDTLHAALFTQAGTPRSLSSLEKHDPAYGDHAAAVQDAIEAVRDPLRALALAEWLTPALALGRAFTQRWEESKLREGLVDFDDLIRRAADLLTAKPGADWIRYKLDRRFDHVLIDEAQDTNAAQWQIVDALTDDFFAGLGQKDERTRTLFVVGDYKQAIFRFQGTSPENFEAAKQRVRAAIGGARDNAAGLRASMRLPELRDLDLERSFRTAQPVLDLVDDAIRAIGPQAFGLDAAPPRHIGEDRPGYIALWPPVGGADEAGDAAESADDDAGDDSWLSRPDRLLAERIARQTASWMEHGFPLVKGGQRRAGPGDVMVLVRKRKDLAGLIVARLHAAGVPVAGVDRLRLGAPLAVQDLMAALRFAVQPLDDLNLAGLLVSPLFAWSQGELLEHGWRPDRVRLWDHLRDSNAPLVREAVARLEGLLSRSDFHPPEDLLHWLLVGPWDGRRRLAARLGSEANDPIDELLNAAFAYSAGHPISLQGFIRWFDAGDADLKREQGESAGQVRVMTVHGSKGLQAPIVILADATGNPAASRAGGAVMREPVRAGLAEHDQHRPEIPVPPMPGQEKPRALLEAEAAAAAEELKEHWRLLYVAMTRAEEALFIGGALGAREKEPAGDSWYSRLAELFAGEALDDAVWGTRHERGALAALPPRAANEEADFGGDALPDWALQPIGPEPRPPRPLTPSRTGVDDAPEPPSRAGADPLAARRGTLLHRLLERSPELPAEERADAAMRWLEREAQEFSADDRAAMAAEALAVLADPAFADVFAPDTLAEVPLAATVGGQVIAGIADRLLVEPQRVIVVDFKTTRRPPADVSAVPVASLRQMAAYAAALRAIFPGRAIEAALLYTHAPRLIALPEELLAAHKPSLAASTQSF